MIRYDPLWRYLASTDPKTGKRRKMTSIYDDPKYPDRHEPIGISKPTIDRMRAGLSCSFDTLDRICERLGLQPGDILEWVPGRQPEYIRPANREAAEE